MAGTYLEIGGGSGGGGGPAGPAPVQHSVDTFASLPGAGEEDGSLIYVKDTESIFAWDAVGVVWKQILNGLADVSGPSGSTNGAVAVFDSTTGKLIKESPVTISPAGNVLGVNNLTATGAVAANSLSTATQTSFAAMTTVTRNAITATNGMLIYNSDVDKFQGYAAGAWVDLHGWGV